MKPPIAHLELGRDMLQLKTTRAVSVVGNPSADATRVEREPRCRAAHQDDRRDDAAEPAWSTTQARGRRHRGPRGDRPDRPLARAFACALVAGGLLCAGISVHANADTPRAGSGSGARNDAEASRAGSGSGARSDAALRDGEARSGTSIDIPKTKARIELPDGWEPIKNPTLVLAYKHVTTRAVLAVTRADVPNPDAWKSETKQAYADEVERGIKAAVKGYKRTSKKLGLANGVPALDVEARRDGGATLVIRVLLFRTYALSLAIEVPKGDDVRPARAIAATFSPPKE